MKSDRSSSCLQARRTQAQFSFSLHNFHLICEPTSGRHLHLQFHHNQPLRISLLLLTTVGWQFWLLSGEVRGSPLSPPLRTQHESFQLTALKPYFKRDLTWVLCTCLWHGLCRCWRFSISFVPPSATGTIWWVSISSPLNKGSPHSGHFQSWFSAIL